MKRVVSKKIFGDSDVVRENREKDTDPWQSKLPPVTKHQQLILKSNISDEYSHIE